MHHYRARRLQAADHQRIPIRGQETGYVIEMLRSCYCHEVCLAGEAVSDSDLRALRGSRLEIRFLPDNASEICVVS